VVPLSAKRWGKGFFPLILIPGCTNGGGAAHLGKKVIPSGLAKFGQILVELDHPESTRNEVWMVPDENSRINGPKV